MHNPLFPVSVVSGLEDFDAAKLAFLGVDVGCPLQLAQNS